MNAIGSLARVFIGVSVLAACAGEASAQASYVDRHGFSIQFGQAVPATARWQHFEHTWMYWEGAGDVVQTNPSVQPPGWFPRAPVGFDPRAMRATGMNDARQPMWLNMAVEDYDPRLAFDQQRSIAAHANVGVSTARASLRTSPDPSNPTILNGTIGVDGSIDPGIDHHKGGLASSISVLRFDVTSQDQWPRIINWVPDIQVTSNGAGTYGADNVMIRPRDPIYFERFGPDGEVERIAAVDIWLEDVRANDPAEPMTFEWSNGHLRGTNVGDLTLRAQVGGPMMLNDCRGDAIIHFVNGWLVESIGSGIFEHTMPPLGMPGIFDVPFIDTMNLGFTPLDLPPGYTGAFELSSGLNIPSPGAVLVLLAAGMTTRRLRRGES